MALDLRFVESTQAAASGADSKARAALSALLALLGAVGVNLILLVLTVATVTIVAVILKNARAEHKAERRFTIESGAVLGGKQSAVPTVPPPPAPAAAPAMGEEAPYNAAVPKMPRRPNLRVLKSDQVRASFGKSAFNCLSPLVSPLAISPELPGDLPSPGPAPRECSAAAAAPPSRGTPPENVSKLGHCLSPLMSPLAISPELPGDLPSPGPAPRECSAAAAAPPSRGTPPESVSKLGHDDIRFDIQGFDL